MNKNRVYLGLLKKNALHRLGCTGNESQIRNQTFFKDIDWDALEKHKVKPPRSPSMNPKRFSFFSIKYYCTIAITVLFELQEHPRDITHFDTIFTDKNPTITILFNNKENLLNVELKGKVNIK